eukprot:TRINITY_DN23476_c0_g1_i1.p1 TRINITY_DN23476_c0_g1~~TRINITY_DN23476_c0_g1_i1.p1  ORF type:complete len:333 (+),score=51.18 TRINITY_DN23476_c0_g1_i1:87-1085(+)
MSVLHGSLLHPTNSHTDPHHAQASQASGPLAMGMVCGLLHAVGPDHLATLAAFSANMEPWPAAKVGASWGIGHGAGIIAVGFLSLVVDQIPGVHLQKRLESFGDYIIGVSMILVAVYFLIREADYVTVQDGAVTVHGCNCCSLPMPVQSAGPKARSTRSIKKRFCKNYSGGDDDRMPSSSTSSSSGCQEEECLECTEDTPLSGGKGIPKGVPKSVPERRASSVPSRDVKSAIVGLVQGMCCPMGLVQISYLAGAGNGPVDVFIFIAVTIVVSVTGTALFAAFWARFVSSRTFCAVDPRWLYRGSCGLALCLGTTWIAANYLNVLDKVNYAEH